MQRNRAIELGVIAAALLLIAALSMLRSAQNAAAASAPSTYDTGANGYAALFELLAREGSPVRRFERPIGEISRGEESLVLAGDGALDDAAPSASARSVLDRWVSTGGRLIVLDARIGAQARRAFGLPQAADTAPADSAATSCAFVPHLRGLRVSAPFAKSFPGGCSASRASVLRAGRRVFAVTYRRGRGSITVFGSSAPFDNLHLSQSDNARVAYAIFGGAAAFDERVHGYAEGRSFWEVLPEPMRIAIAIAIAAALLAILGANLPFAPPYDAAAPEERDSSAYIASVARMLERGGAVREAIARIAAACERVLAPRAAGDERARMLLREVRTLEGTPRPGAHDLLHAGRIFARVRKDYGC